MKPSQSEIDSSVKEARQFEADGIASGDQEIIVALDDQQKAAEARANESGCDLDGVVAANRQMAARIAELERELHYAAAGKRIGDAVASLTTEAPKTARCGNVDCGPNCTHGLSVVCGHDDADSDCNNQSCAEAPKETPAATGPDVDLMAAVKAALAKRSATVPKLDDKAIYGEGESWAQGQRRINQTPAAEKYDCPCKECKRHNARIDLEARVTPAAPAVPVCGDVNRGRGDTCNMPLGHLGWHATERVAWPRNRPPKGAP